MPVRPFDLISRDAQTALTQFDYRFQSMLDNAPPAWARQLGFYYPSKALKTRFPVSISAAGYKEIDGDIGFRTLSSKFLEMMPKEWSDGVSEKASIIEAPDFIGWDKEAQAMAQAANTAPNRWVADLIEDGESADAWDGRKFFATNHYIDAVEKSGSQSNLHASSAFSLANLTLSRKHMRAMKKPNGEALGLRVTHLFVTGHHEEEALGFLNKEIIAEGGIAQSNTQRARGTTLVVLDEYTGLETDWFTACLDKPGLDPWIVQDEGAPEKIIHDKNSDLYKRTLRIGFASILRGNAALASFHGFHKYKVAA